MGVDPTSVIIKPKPKGSGSGSNILNATYLTINEINSEFLFIGFAAKSSPPTQKITNLAQFTPTLDVPVTSSLESLLNLARIYI